MLIKDLFSHKIHSSSDEWPLKLIEIASVFAQFDGLPYDRGAIDERFKQISPRASSVARDPSKFRDEITAYPAYFGLYRLEKVKEEWILHLTETAKRFLIGEEPNVPAFLILQLSMLQFPNGNGASYSNKKVRLQNNASEKTLNFIKNGVHLSPFRLICKALIADSIISGTDSHHPRISVNELSILCNDSRINQSASPKLDDITNLLIDIRTNNIPPVSDFENRFHLLNHTDLIEATSSWIYLRPAYSPTDAARQIRLLTLISSIDIQFDNFDSITTHDQLQSAIASGEWSKYFDGVVQLPSDLVQEVAGEISGSTFSPSANETDELIADNKAIVFKYPLRERGAETFNEGVYRKNVLADPEVTRIKRQKSNLQHKILMSQLDEHLRKLGAIPKENEHIDLYAELDNSKGFLFEIKSVHSENLLSQTRKGLSQLYEYRYRYSADILKDSTLCLLYTYEPNEINWLQDYLCKDRRIAVAWFDNEKFCYPDICKEMLLSLNVL
ncbi:MAG: hypothetical protein V4520_07035 [Bacteroidota bacterium]